LVIQTSKERKKKGKNIQPIMGIEISVITTITRL
jgi:hypothetical protein